MNILNNPYFNALRNISEILDEDQKKRSLLMWGLLMINAVFDVVGLAAIFLSLIHIYLENLKDIQGKPNYTFVKGDIGDDSLVSDVFSKYDISHVVHLAAESHVDRSIKDPLIFLKTNILGTANLLQNAKKHWAGNYEGKLFYHISTDEVYGSLEMGTDMFTEQTPYDPRSPYSASKASSCLLYTS